MSMSGLYLFHSNATFVALVLWTRISLWTRWSRLFVKYPSVCAHKEGATESMGVRKSQRTMFETESPILSILLQHEGTISFLRNIICVSVIIKSSGSVVNSVSNNAIIPTKTTDRIVKDNRKILIQVQVKCDCQNSLLLGMASKLCFQNLESQWLVNHRNMVLDLARKL